MWYKVHAMFGPGHQSKDTFYRWSEAVLDEEGKHELAQEMFDRWPHTEQIRVDVNKVKALPVSVRDSMSASCRSRIHSAQFMLDILGDPEKTPVETCQEPTRKAS